MVDRIETTIFTDREKYDRYTVAHLTFSHSKSFSTTIVPDREQVQSHTSSLSLSCYLLKINQIQHSILFFTSLLISTARFDITTLHFTTENDC